MSCRAVQRSALCRSRRELSNAYLLANFGFDTAENELSKVCPIPRGAARSAVGLSFAVAAAAGSRRDARVPDAFEPISREEVDY